MSRIFSSILQSIPIITATLPVFADTVVLTGRPPFEGVTVLDFRQDHLVFRGVSDQILRKPLTEIDSIELDDHTIFTAAETAAARGDWSVALENYDAALRSGPTGWRGDLFRARTIRAADHAGRFDRAVELFIELAANRPSVGGSYIPQFPGPPRSDVNARARAVLERALRGPSRLPGANRLQQLWTEAVLWDDEDPGLLQVDRSTETQPSAADNTPPPQGRRQIGILPTDSTGSSGTTPTTKPAYGRRPLGILPDTTGPTVPPSTSATESPPETTGEPATSDTRGRGQHSPADSPPASAEPKGDRPLGLLPHADGPSRDQRPATPAAGIVLDTDSMTFRAARDAVERGEFARAERLLTRAMRFVPAEFRAPWRLLHGRCLIELGQATEARTELASLARDATDPTVAGWAVYYGARAEERLGRIETADAIFAELVSGPHTPEIVRAAAAEARVQLGGRSQATTTSAKNGS